jgi:predicted flavoprotein YhiN
MSLIVIIILMIIPSISIATPIDYSMFNSREIKVVVKNPNYDKLQEKLAKLEEIKIEAEIQELEREEKQQIAKATRLLQMELSSLKPFVTLFHTNGTVTTSVNKLFIQRLLYPDTWNKG